MKRIICMLLALVMCLGLCACGGTTTTNKDNVEVSGWGPYIYIRNTDGFFDDVVSNGYWLGYHRDTRVVFELYGVGSNLGTIVPYQIYQDGVIYGAVYEDGEILPIPYAMGITFDMIKLASKFLE